MFAGERAPHFEAGGQDILRAGQGAIGTIRGVRVKQDERVDIAVAGVRDVGHFQFVGPGDAVDRLQNVSQTAAGHDTVVGVVGRRYFAHGARDMLPPEP